MSVILSLTLEPTLYIGHVMIELIHRSDKGGLGTETHEHIDVEERYVHTAPRADRIANVSGRWKI